ncbi:hypothetical protein OHA98_17190 [Streptomyces sp. NBC_00654]|uniref:hypothetical protein n=1 Tax=Streptomyces sp. NBC_00654 TaxID=2975799 RepID=UPI002252E7DE|nr:hypothetical protein [Streptomyces sp. NBC_00654]MCX4966542.1 hypothetical protein [Streptomyces sp. NBC_00654]
MSFPPPGRHSGAAHHEYCNNGLCCRCQMRTWSAKVGNERLCGPCASCCRDCGRAPAPQLDGLDDGLCAECRGLCGRCRTPRRPDGSCECRRWREGAKGNPQGYVLQALPPALMQAFGGRVPQSVQELIHQELGRRTAGALRERIERRWNLRWAHALNEKDEEGRRRWSAEDIADRLLRPGQCSDPQCEDGHLITTDAPCGHCRRPTHRFVTSVADRTATPEHARSAAAGIRRAMLENRSRQKRPRR